MLRPLVTVILCIGAAVLPSVAQATLVYDKGNLKRSVWIADDDGSGARKLVADGSQPRIAADGKTIVYYKTGDPKTFRPDLMAVSADGSAAPRVLLKGWRDTYTFAWTPDS